MYWFNSLSIAKSCPIKETNWQTNAIALESKKVQGIFGKMFILALLSSAVFCLQNSVSDFF